MSENSSYARNPKKKMTADDVLDPYKDIELYLEKAQEEIGHTFSTSEVNENGFRGCLDKKKVQFSTSFNDDENVNNRNRSPCGIRNINSSQGDDRQMFLHKITQKASTKVEGKGHSGNSRLSEVQMHQLPYDRSPALSRKQIITTSTSSGEMRNSSSFWPAGPSSWRAIGTRTNEKKEQTKDSYMNANQIMSHYITAQEEVYPHESITEVMQCHSETPNLSWKNGSYSMSTGRSRKHFTTRTSDVKSEVKNCNTFRSDLILASSKLASSTGSLDIHILSNWANKLADEMNSFATQHALEKFDSDDCFRLRNEPHVSSSWLDVNRQSSKYSHHIGKPRFEEKFKKIKKSWEEKISHSDAKEVLQFQMDIDDEDDDEVFVKGFSDDTAATKSHVAGSRHDSSQKKLYISESHHYVNPSISKMDSAEPSESFPEAQLRYIQEVTIDIDRKLTQEASSIENEASLQRQREVKVVERSEVMDVPHQSAEHQSLTTVDVAGVSQATQGQEESNLSIDGQVHGDLADSKLNTGSTKLMEQDTSADLNAMAAPTNTTDQTTRNTVSKMHKDNSTIRSRLGSSPTSPLDPDDVRAFIRRVETSILESSDGSSMHFKASSSRHSAQSNATAHNKDFRNTSTQTSPLVSRSSSFLWFSDLDLRDGTNLQQFDAVTGSVNSLLSSCSSLETFSEGSPSKLSCDDSDSSTTDENCSNHNVNFLVIREGNECSNLDLPDEFCSGSIRLSIHCTKSDMTVNGSNGEQSDDMCSTSAQITSDSEAALDIDNVDSASYQSKCLTPVKSLSEISIAKSTISMSSSSLVGSSSSVQSVRDNYSELNFSECAHVKDGNVKEGELTVKSEPGRSLHLAVNKTSSLTPPPKLKPLVLRTASAASAPSSAASTPICDLRDTAPASADVVHDHSVLSLSIFDIASKSSSAPILDLRTPSNVTGGALTLVSSPTSWEKTNINVKVIPPPRSQSVKELAELEAVEACKWLRAAGFPQYAQMFEDMQFPINIAAVQKDHYFLDQDSIQSLFRRLNALNRCARMRLDSIPRKTAEDSDEEEQCALSENWTFQRQSRRWSRVSSSLEPNATLPRKNESHTCKGVYGKYTELCSSPKDTKKASLKSQELDIPESPIPMDEDGSGGSTSVGSLSASDKMDDSFSFENRSFRRTNSERFRDHAKAFLRRIESLKTRSHKRRNREAVVISGPQVLDLDEMQNRMQKLACVDITPPNSVTSSPQLIHHSNNSDGRGVTSEDNSSTNSTSDTSQTSTPTTHVRNGHWGTNHHGSNSSEHGAFSDSECSPTLWRAHCDANSNETKFIEHYIPVMTEVTLPKGYAPNSNQVNGRTGSFNLGNDSLTFKEKFLERQKMKNNCRSNEKRQGVYDSTSLHVSSKVSGDSANYVRSKDRSNKLDNQIDNKRVGYLQDSDSCSSVSTNQDGDFENQKSGSQPDESPVVKTKSCHQQTNVNHCAKHSQQMTAFSKHPCSSLSGNSFCIGKLSAAQLMMLRKLSLLKLTALMERYSPSNRSGWSWIMPKFIKRMKAPDYKDKVIFGVPLSVIYQQAGQPLPPSIQAAMDFLQQNAAESVGLFRKSGVRSRIQKLKNMNEANPGLLSYEGQQAYDVADMLKQYFRELPEALFTNKMSETFICIYQYIPEALRHDALQAAVMLMPDENREVLHILLNFLHGVSQQSHTNQMTASNLAVCFAPSLFHMNSTRSSSSSPRRRKTVGVPDTKELNENKAAHECLTYMIMEHKRLFTVPADTVHQCCLSVSDVDCVPLEDLGHANDSVSGNWQTYISGAIDEMLKESKDRFKGWVSLATAENAEIAYRKVGDGNPLRQWKVSVEVEAPPIELLTRVLRERHLWDTQVLQWNVVSRLNNNSEIFHYVCKSMSPLPSRDYCILRSWKTDLPKGACMLVETSVDHPDVPVGAEDVRGYILISRYLIEPCGSGKSRITHISRIDTKGRSPEWYPKIYSHNCAVHLIRICESFRLKTDGPESKV